MGKMRLSDAGSVDGDEKLSVTIDPATSVMFFDLYVVTEHCTELFDACLDLLSAVADDNIMLV